MSFSKAVIRPHKQHRYSKVNNLKTVLFIFFTKTDQKEAVYLTLD